MFSKMAFIEWRHDLLTWICNRLTKIRDKDHQALLEHELSSIERKRIDPIQALHQVEMLSVSDLKDHGQFLKWKGAMGDEMVYGGEHKLLSCYVHPGSRDFRRAVG